MNSFEYLFNLPSAADACSIKATKNKPRDRDDFIAMNMVVQKSTNNWMLNHKLQLLLLCPSSLHSYNKKTQWIYYEKNKYALYEWQKCKFTEKLIKHKFSFCETLTLHLICLKLLRLILFTNMLHICFVFILMLF